MVMTQIMGRARNQSHVKGLCKVITEMPELDAYDCYT